MSSEVLLFVAVGRTLIFLVQKSPYLKSSKLPSFIRELVACDLCLGVWIYTVLALVTRHNWLIDWGYIPVMSEVLTGICASTVMWLIRMGWDSYFKVYQFDEE